MGRLAATSRARDWSSHANTSVVHFKGAASLAAARLRLTAFQNTKQAEIHTRSAKLQKLEEQGLFEGKISGSALDSSVINDTKRLIPDILSTVDSVQHRLAKSRIYGSSPGSWIPIAVNFIETCVREACAGAFVL